MLNKAILIGRLTADPELKQTPNGVSVTSFSIAVNRSYAGRNGERATDFLNIVCWRQQAEFVCKYFHKGNAIGIDGSIQTRDYTDQNGNKRRAFEIVADNVFFVESKSASAASSAPSFEPPAQVSSPAASFSNGDLGDFQEIEGDDDLPF